MRVQIKKVRLQKQVSYKYKDHPIYKYRLNIPSEIVEELNWDSPNTEVEMTLKNRKLEIARIS